MERIEKVDKLVNAIMDDDMDRIEKVNKIVDAIMEILPREPGHNRFWCNGEEILVDTEVEAEYLADFFNQLYGEGTVNTGYYDPVEDERNGETDKYTGYYYVSFV